MARKSVNLLPAFFRTDKNQKFLSSTLDQFIAEPKLERLDAFAGSKLSKNFNPNEDIYITDPNNLRNKYQLEPGLVIKELDGSIKKIYAYDDLVNQLSYHNALVDNHNKLFKPDFYSYDPQIDWDKLINFRDYFWLPTGPTSIKVTGTQREVTSTYSVSMTDDDNFFVFTPDGLTPDPQITLYRGVTYIFNVDTAKKFYIKKNIGTALGNSYDEGVTNNGTKKGQIIFTVSYTTPNILYYSSDNDQTAGGQILIKTIEENSTINVDKEILGKRQYKSGNNIEFINGLKVFFGGDVMPASYREKEFLVEGVGDSIRLVDFTDLDTPESSATAYDVDFDSENFDVFPFDNFKNVPLDPSYITINRASKDLNPWTRYNRWFHADVLRAVAATKKEEAILPIEQQAKRPIIEFKPDIQLYNFGKSAIKNVDLIDNLTTDVFSNVENSVGYWVDEVLLEEGFRVIFNADPDPLVRARVYEVRFTIVNGQKRINLFETDDHIPTEGACVTVTRGTQNKGKVYWYTTVDGVLQWKLGQQKTSINQAPLFDIFDDSGYSYSGTPYTSNFRGSKVFGYAEGNVYDSVLGLSLKYQSNGLESSYLFTNYFTTDKIIRVFPDINITINANIGFLKSNKNLNTARYFNVWTEAENFDIPVLQPEVIYENFNRIQVTVFDNPTLIDDLSAEVFVNDKKYNFNFVSEEEDLYIVLEETIAASTYGNRILCKFYTSSAPNAQGQYETPLNYTNNPLNGPAAEFTLSELFDHVKTMVDRDPEFSGSLPGASNLKSLPNIGRYGTRIIVNENSLAMSHYFISNKEHNLIEAIKEAGEEYNQFKLNFIKAIADIDETTDPTDAVDQIFEKFNENKNTTFPYLYSDMVPYGTNKKVRNYTVTDSRNTEYAISSIFNLTSLSNQAVFVYLNGVQLTHGRDYFFNEFDATVTIKTLLTKGDKLRINEYLDTDGCYCPPTPTKLGLYPKYEPTIYLDDTYALEPKNVIQGHDGSLILAFNDYRDNIIIEFEKRIFNNIKTEYRESLFDINSVLPNVFKNTAYSYDQIHSYVSDYFLKWTGFYGIDYESNQLFDIDNSKTYNFTSATDGLFNGDLPGSWRAIFKYYFGTDRPHTHPWELLGITIKPEWWDDRYGVAPYTSGNTVLWDDLEQGRVAQGPNAGVKTEYQRPGLSQVLPVDEYGNLVDPRNWGPLKLNDGLFDIDQNWRFGDIGPAENAWRRSSLWPFACQIIAALSRPADYSAKLFDTSRIIVNSAGQFVYTDNQFITPSILKIQGVIENGEVIKAAGYSVYVIERGKKRISGYLTELSNDLAGANFNLVNKVGGFVTKDKLSIVIDAVQLGSQNPTPYLPNDDYTVYFNVSNPIKTLAVSGVIVIKSNGVFVVKGYDRQNLYFKILSPIKQFADPIITVGSRSEEFVSWTANQVYVKGQLVFYNNVYYRVTQDHKSGVVFNTLYYKALDKLPVVGGVRIQKSVKYETTETIVAYGTEFYDVQSVADFLLGYGKWLESQGFEFNEYNQDFQQVVNWDFSVKEFAYWTTQNWANNSLITLSPFANSLTFNFKDGIVDNIFDSFYQYSLLRADGIAFSPKNFNVVRQENKFVVKTKNTPEGLYFAKLNLVQKEHVLVFNNKTIFGDVIYKVDSGYRQNRVKLKGFKTAEWNGDFFSPGFVYDESKISNWTPYTDYLPADVVEYVGKFYSAKKKLPGTEEFDFSNWYVLSEKPKAELLPNFEYKINQFEDFYSLDIDNFDLAQQKMAQHLIGYNSRPYLENIFDNPISQYKFYQGYIKEKGTKNAIDKLEKASLENLQGRIEFNEEWAFRIGYYGGYSSYNEIELPLRERDFIENSQVIQFVDRVPSTVNDLTSYITPVDVTIKPVDFNPENTFVTSTSTYLDNQLLLPHAGYVRLDDADYVYLRVEDILTEDNSKFVEGDKFWIGFDSTDDWNIYRYTKQFRYITSVASGANTTELVFTTNKAHGLQAGEIISVTRMSDVVNGVFVITDIPTLNTFTVNKPDITFVPDDLPPGTMFKLASVRFNNIDNIASLPNLANINSNELFWVDDNGTGKWAVYRRIDNYDSRELLAPKNNPRQGYGYRISTQENTSTLVVSANNFYDITGGYGRIYVYDYKGGSFNPVINFSLNKSTDEYRLSNDKAGFGDTVIFDETDGLVFASAAEASFVKVDTSGSVRQARPTNAVSTLTNVGLVKISGVFTSPTTFSAEIPYATLVSPVSQSGSKFGSGLFVQRQESSKILLVGAPGINTGTGVVYRYTVNAPDNERFYSAITGTNSAGFGASFDVSFSGRSYSAAIVNTGTGYSTGSISLKTITIAGANLGGLTPDNNLFVTINSVNGTGSVVDYSVTGTAALKSFSIATTASQTSLPMTGGLMPTVSLGYNFGQKIVGTKDATIVAVAAPGYNNDVGAVYVYQLQANVYTWLQTISANDTEYSNKIKPGDKLGSEIAISEDGNYLFVATKTATEGSVRPGKVGVYKWNDTEYQFVQLINNPSREQDLYFGESISVNSSATILAVTSKGSNLFNSIVFDDGLTTFDGEACTFSQLTPQSGTAYIFNRYNEKFILSQELFDDTVDSGSYYGTAVQVLDNRVLVGSPNSIISNNQNGSVYIWDEIIPEYNSWQEYRVQNDLVDISLIKKAKTIDTLEEQVIDYLDIIDPLKGRIPGIADQEIRYKTPFDPAVYKIGTESVVVDEDTFWSESHVGELWWDLSTVKYVWYEQGDVLYRKTTWGQLFPGATIDVYEWVESVYLPSQWAAIADTNEGLTQGISGIPKDFDDTVYSTRSIFDKKTNQFTNLYYFWVKNKTLKPNVKNRTVPALEVASLLSSPKSYGLKYLAILGPDAVSLTNFKNSLISDRIYLNIGFDNIDNSVNKHTEWALVQEDNPYSVIPRQLERKLLDSLLGKDTVGNAVPDPALPARLKYGIEVRPKQSMFKDRTVALKNLIDYTNYVLKKNILVGQISFGNLNSKEEIPDVLIGEYDDLYEDVEGLNSIITRSFQQAEVTCTVENGRINSVTVTKSGYGYKNPPTIKLANSDTVVEFKTIISTSGELSEVKIVNGGTGFVSAPTLVVRPYTVIIQVDPDFNDKWSKHEWSGSAWIRVQTQKFDTSKYWSYIDWQAESYNYLKPLTYTVQETYQVQTLELATGDYVKVINPGDNKYMILEKTDGYLGTFDNNFNIVYKQGGTIQFSTSVYDLKNAQLGFDDQTTFDQLLFDEYAEIELQKILTAIKEDIFVGPLKVYWNKFFFRAVKYALTEQKFLDWAFKTSFINVRNIAGVLDQRPSYRFLDPTWYEDYIKEIKPYHTLLRNYQVNYQVGKTIDTPWEESNTYNTDFDLPSVYDNSSQSFITVSEDNELINQYPYKSWANNKGLEIQEISLASSGSGYRTVPKVEIVAAAGDTGFGATAVAYIAYGRITEIEVTDSGNGYTKTPTVLIIGGGDNNLVPAKAYAVLQNKKVRSNKIGIKFDRVTAEREIGSTSTNFTTTTDGSSYIYDLPWYSTTDKQDIDVTLNGIIVLETDYYINNFKQEFNGYTKKYSQIVLENIPTKGQTLSVTFKKNIDLYTAAERVQDYYNPADGMPGKQLSQVMYGAEYPGVTIDTQSFESSAFWDVTSFETSAYASDIENYARVTVQNTATAGTATIVVSTLTGVVAGKFANIISTATNAFATTGSVYITAVNTITKAVTFNSTLTINIPPSYKIELWNLVSTSTNLDTVIDGGSITTSSVYLNDAWVFANAKGLRADDIILDGDQFVSPNTSYAPEECVPGQVQEAVSISVFTKEPEGAPLIVTQSYYIDQTATNTTVDLTLQPVNTSSVMASYNGKSLIYSRDFNINFNNKTITLNTQTVKGSIAITVVGVGGKELVATRAVSVVGTSTTISTTAKYADVGSVYVTNNGETLTQNIDYITTATTKGRADLVVNLNTGTNLIQLWMFRSAHKAYSEVKEQIIDVTSTATTFALIQRPGNLGPLHAQVIVEKNGYRLVPPDTTYYKIDSAQTVFEIRPDETASPGVYSPSQVEVHRNGIKLRTSIDYIVDAINNTVIFNANYLQIGDVIAITSLLASEYRVDNGNVELSVAAVPGDVVKVITYTNHDAAGIRTEVYKVNGSKLYRMARPVLKDSYVWVSVGGKSLINRFDYRVMEDGVTVKLADYVTYSSTDKVVITSFSDIAVNKCIGYRQFHDILGRSHFKRYSEFNTAYLAQDLAITDTEIYVDNGGVLPIPVPSQNAPGVVFIAGERIEYFVKTGNVLSRIKRATLGTGAKDLYNAGTAVLDQGRNQNVPYKETVYTYNTVTNVVTTTNTASVVLSTIEFNENADLSDQVEVYYRGRKLIKSTVSKHNFDVSYDSGETVYSDTDIEPEFTVNSVAGQNILTLNLQETIVNNARITVIHKKGQLWYEQGTTTVTNGLSLLETNTVQAQFLLDKQAGIPDKYQYGQL